MCNTTLWEISGHAENYKVNMFVFGIDKQEFGLKPMRDFGVLHRNELNGALSGLTSVRSFEQDDAHIFCRECDAGPEKYLGEIEHWDKAEGALAEALNNEGDVLVCNITARLSTTNSIQAISYSAEDEAKREKPVMIHRAVLGSVERMLTILVEHYKGKWPFWPSPRQAIIQKTGYYVDVDITDRKIGKKIREAQLAQYNYMLVVGEAEVNSGTVSRRDRDDSDKAKPRVMSVEELLKFFNEEAAAFR
ncbi:hypothetical protein MKX03_021108 [Papaver bracteatum]|nr:hypothetical protein MKX03_021108 [Papaver bracteatum]